MPCCRPSARGRRKKLKDGLFSGSFEFTPRMQPQIPSVGQDSTSENRRNDARFPLSDYSNCTIIELRRSVFCWARVLQLTVFVQFILLGVIIARFSSGAEPAGTHPQRARPRTDCAASGTCQQPARSVDGGPF